MNLLAKIHLFLHKKFPRNIPVMTCYGCLKDDCSNRTKKHNRICKGYKKGKKNTMLFVAKEEGE